MVSGTSPFTIFHVVLSLIEGNRGIAMAAARLYVAEDIAKAVLSLASGGSSYVRGAEIVFGGGNMDVPIEAPAHRS